MQSVVSVERRRPTALRMYLPLATMAFWRLGLSQNISQLILPRNSGGFTWKFQIKGDYLRMVEIALQLPEDLRRYSPRTQVKLLHVVFHVVLPEPSTKIYQSFWCNSYFLQKLHWSYCKHWLWFYCFSKFHSKNSKTQNFCWAPKHYLNWQQKQILVVFWGNFCLSGNFSYFKKIFHSINTTNHRNKFFGSPRQFLHILIETGLCQVF